MKAFLFLFFLSTSAIAQGLGHHPTGDDPYGSATSIAGANCCHGQDCARFEGMEPDRAMRDGRMGWLFAGKWFFRDDQEIRADSLKPEAKAFTNLCINTANKEACFWVPRSG